MYANDKDLIYIVHKITLFAFAQQECKIALS